MSDECVDPTDITGVNERTRAWGRAGETIVPIEMDRIVIEQERGRWAGHAGGGPHADFSFG